MVLLSQITHIEGLILADENVDGRNLDVDVLIGLDFYHDFFTGEMRKASNGPVVLESVLGWVLSGKYPSPNDQPQHCLQTHMMRAEVEREVGLREELGKFWEIESVGNKEFSVIDDFENHIYHDGIRYVTKLPFKPDHDPLPDNFGQSQRRLKSTVKKLRSQGIYDDYHEIFKEYEKEGIIEKYHLKSCIRKTVKFIIFLTWRL